MTSSTTVLLPDTERVAAEQTLRLPAERHFRSSSFPLVHNVQGKEFIVVIVVEPATRKIKQAQPGPPGQGQRIHHQLHDWLFFSRPRLVINNVNLAVSYLNNIDVV